MKKKNPINLSSPVSLKLNPRNQRNLNQAAILCVQFMVLLCLPELAFADIEDTIDWAVDLLTGRIARGCAIIALAGCGYMAWAGQLSWSWAIKIVIGIVFVFGGVTLVDEISGTV